MGGTLFFTADDGIHGRELWKSDGTKAGTVLVKDIDPNAGTYGSSPSSLTGVGGTLFFTADDGIHGRELWKSDGTNAGTVLVKAIDPNDGGYDDEGGPSSLTRVGATLFFTADDGIHGSELWKSDGTNAGTVLVKAIDPNNGYYDEGGPSDLTGVGGTLFFTADDGIRGAELWKSDGTRAGTVLVKDIHPGDYPSDPSSMADVAGTLFFVARDGIHGSELWKSDGTNAGTVLVKDIQPGARHGSPSSLTGVGGTLFFTADDGIVGSELWKSDGTNAGTVLVKAIDPDDRAYNGEYGPSMTGVGGTLFFTPDDGTHGSELWKSDGTNAGTVLVKDIHPDAYNSDPDSLTGVGGTLFFTARDGIHGSELWKSDGTNAGTVLVRDIQPGARRGYYVPESLTGVGETLFFAADDRILGEELWKSNGTTAGTVVVKDINAGGRFTVASNGTASTSTGTLTVRVAVAGAGRLRVRPAAGSAGKLKWSVRDVAQAGPTTITLRPTKAGTRILKRDGRLRVNARFTFTPCGGTGTSVIRQYTLRMR